MARFYLAQELYPNQYLELSEKIIRHLHVLRVKEGEEIILFNGNGNVYYAQLTQLQKHCAIAKIQHAQKIDNESPLKINLIQAISSGERMDFTLQKSVELGVSSIQPILSERCVVRLAGERADKKITRWQEIVISACEQCGRNIVPRVKPLLTFQQALQQLPAADAYLLMELNQSQSLKNIDHSVQNISFMVGPEGGWTAAEEQQALNAGFKAITLGARILRTETASLAAIAAMQTLWGDFL